MTLSEARRKAGLSLKEVGRQMFVCGSSVQQRECGRLFISEEELEFFCRLYRCSPEDLDLVRVVRYIVPDPTKRKGAKK